MPKYIVTDSDRFCSLGDKVELKEYKNKRLAEKDNENSEVVLANKKNLLEVLDELLAEEHTDGCDNTTCNCDTAHDHGYLLHALWCFDGSGACSTTFDTLYAELSNMYKDIFKESMKQAGKMCKEVPNATCPHCNAVTWSEDLSTKEEWNCESCAKNFLPTFDEEDAT